jgi:DNA-binding transcriptional MocR family regulator
MYRTPLYESLALDIEQAILAGHLPPGASLPSLRECAFQRSMSLNTVTAAYRLLEDRGLIEARPKSGFYVCSTLPEPRQSLCTGPSVAIFKGQEDLMAQVLEAQRQPGNIDLAFAGPRGKRFYPGDQIARISASLLRRRSDLVSTYALPPGSQILREQIAKRAVRLGMNLDAEQIVLTHGAVEALQLALRAVTRPGDQVAVEAPSYFNLYPLLTSLGLKALELPTHPRTGLEMDAVEAVFASRQVAALVTMPTVHNPLGCSMPVESKERLARLAAATEVPVIEDAIYAELQFQIPLQPTVKAFDRQGWVIVCSGFSKTLAPDSRIGWMEGGRFGSAIQRLKFTSSASESMLLSETLGVFLDSGGYEHHLKTLRRLYHAQVSTVRSHVARHFPAGTQATQPEGGFLLWVEVPKSVDCLDLFRAALAERIVIMPGQVYSSGIRYRHCLRLSCCQELDDRFLGALEKLGQLCGALAGVDYARG